MHPELSPDRPLRLWAGREATLVEWPDGSLCRYRGTELDFWYDGGDPRRVEVLWRELRGLAPHEVARWYETALVDDGDGVRLILQERPARWRPLELDIDLGDTPGPRGDDPEWFGRGARHERVAIVDEAAGRVLWMVGERDLRLSGVGSRCRIWPSSLGNRLELWLDGPAGSYRVRVGVLGIDEPPERLPGRLLAPPGQQLLLEIDGTAAFYTYQTRDGRTSIERFAPFDPTGVRQIDASNGWLVHRGHTVEWSDGRKKRWLSPPTPATFEAWPDCVQAVVEPVTWSGPPGPFEISTRIRSVTLDLAGLTLRTGGLPGVRFTEVRVGADTFGPEPSGDLVVPFAPLDRGRTLDLGLKGTILASAVLDVPIELRVPLARASAGPHNLVRAGAAFDAPAVLHLDLQLEDAGIALVRGDRRLALDPRWVADLLAADALDRDAREPDLGRWARRALARCRVRAYADAPDAVLAEWLRMTERDRAATSDAGVPAYKLSSGRHWEVTADEATRIRRALPADHPLAQFATGPFTVEAPDAGMDWS